VSELLHLSIRLQEVRQPANGFNPTFFEDDDLICFVESGFAVADDRAGCFQF